MLVGAAIGRKKSGKTTLAKHLGLEYWLGEDRPSLVLDPNRAGSWGPEFWLAPDSATFWHTAWSTEHCLLIVDDAGKGIDRNPELEDAFTRINHNGHKLLILGHDGVNMTRIMREQVDTLYLFCAGKKSVEAWEEVFPDRPPPKGMTKREEIKLANDGKHNLPVRMEDAMYLQQYEFLYCRQYKPIERMTLNLGSDGKVI